MGAALRRRREGASGREPVTLCILLYPGGEGGFMSGCEAFSGGSDALENIVVVFGDAEDGGVRLWDIPGGLPG